MSGRPLVAVVFSVPLLGEALESALEFADVRSFSGKGGDILGLLRSLRPDAVVVDREDVALDAARYALEQTVPIVRICVHDRALFVFKNGDWSPVPSDGDPTPEVVRNVIAGALFARTGDAA
jgi:hypothetical protein